VEEMVDVATATGNADLLIAGHGLACTCYCYAGEFTKVLEHADKVLDLYDSETHRHLVDLLYRDPKTLAGIFGSISTWILGYPDRALRLILLCHFLIHRPLLLLLPQAARTPGQRLDQPDGDLPANGRDRVRHMPLRPHWRHPAAGNLRVAQVFRSACG
jgi:hypothetical protein